MDLDFLVGFTSDVFWGCCFIFQFIVGFWVMMQGFRGGVVGGSCELGYSALNGKC